MNENETRNFIINFFKDYSEEMNAIINTAVSKVNILEQKFDERDRICADLIAIKQRFNLVELKYEEGVVQLKNSSKKIKLMEDTLCFYKEIIEFMMKNLKSKNDDNDDY